MAGHLYDSRRWRRRGTGLRHQILIRDNYCCTRCGRVEHAPRLHVHHRTPHKNDPELFWNPSNLEPLCEICHNAVATVTERVGYDTTIGPDGLPLDPHHPFYK